MIIEKLEDIPGYNELKPKHQIKLIFKLFKYLHAKKIEDLEQMNIKSIKKTIKGKFKIIFLYSNKEYETEL